MGVKLTQSKFKIILLSMGRSFSMLERVAEDFQKQ